MAMPPLTLSNIQPHLSTVAYNALSKVCYDSALETLSSPNGASVVVQLLASRVQMEWHIDEGKRINGIFLCIYNSSMIQAWKFINEDLHEITILTTPLYTGVSHPILHVSLAERTFGQCVGTDHEEQVQFQAVHLENPGQIHAFFKNNQEMLPEPLRQTLFPPVVERKRRETARRKNSSSLSNNNNNYYYIAGGVLLFLSIAFLSKRYFAKR